MHKFHAFWGVVHLSQKKYNSALTSFQNSLKFPSKDSDVHLYIAETYFRTKDYLKAFKNLDLLAPSHQQKVSYFLLKSRTLWQLNQKSQAYELLQTHPRNTHLVLKQMWSFLLESQLYQESLNFINRHWSLWQQKELLTFVANYKQKEQWDLAANLLEKMRWQWPNSTETVLELAQVYIKKQMRFSAATILEESARSLPSIAFEASAMIRDMGYPRRALHVNLLVEDERKSLKNRLSIYLELENYDLVSKLEPQLEIQGLLSDEDTRYAMAFAHFKSGAFGRSQNHLNQLTRDDLFRKAVEIKKLITTCEKQNWSCYETL
jgi:hypothetical protein